MTTDPRAQAAFLQLKNGTRVEYFDNPYTYHGDYADTGSVGAANVKWLEDNYAAHTVTGWQPYSTQELFLDREWYRMTDDKRPEAAPLIIQLWQAYGTTTFFFRSDIETATTYPEEGDENALEAAAAYELREALEGLEDCPCFDDEIVSEIEVEWEAEAWESWIKGDLIRTLPEDLRDSVGFEDALDDAALFEAYRAAMEQENEYPIPECSVIYVHVDRIAEAFAQHVGEALKQQPVKMEDQA